MSSIDPESPHGTYNWKSNLLFIWISQFVSLAAFSFALPYSAYFIQHDLHVSKQDAVIWNAAFSAAAALSFAIMAPIWGSLSDRYGRRIMLLRANFAGAGIIFCMGMVNHVEWLIALRFMQGIFTGTVSAAQTLVSVSTPEKRHGFALGTLSSAMFCGITAGNCLGGLCADTVGYRATFKLAGIMLLVAGSIVLLFVKEYDHPVDEKQGGNAESMSGAEKFAIRTLVPIMVIICMVSFVRQFDRPIVPLFVQELNGNTIKGSSSIMGVMNGLAGVISVLAGPLAGWLVDRMPVTRIGSGAAVFGGIASFGMGLSRTFAHLYTAQVMVTFFSAALDPVLQVWLSRASQRKSRGSAFGWATSARSMGWIVSPLVAAWVAAQFSVRAVFPVKSVCFLLLIPVMIWASRKLAKNDSTKNTSKIPA